LKYLLIELQKNVMRFINTLSLAPDVNNWLANSRQPRILHVFDHACNLINEDRDVLSIVTPQIGNGPFNLVIDDDILFSEQLSLQSQISNSLNHLSLGNLNINIADAKLWSPCPDWEKLHASKDHILNQLMKLPITNYQFSNSPASNSLISVLANADLPSALNVAQQLAGLGIGLTPAGDDFILGAILAAWIIHPTKIASVVAKEVADTAAPLTTSLSAAWLRSAGRGQAGILWHIFFNALIFNDSIIVQKAVEELLAVGYTSGYDALAGFVGTAMFWKIEDCI
jgi:hypothetical protein